VEPWGPDRVGPPWGAGEAPLASAPVVVAARPLPPLRLAPLPRPPKAEGWKPWPWGFLIVVKGER
jgi:hypothetical protein